MKRLLIVDDEERERREVARIARTLTPDLELTLVGHAEAAAAAKQARFDAIVVEMDHQSGAASAALISSLREVDARAPILVVLDGEDPERAEACMRAGAIECVPRSAFDAERLSRVLRMSDDTQPRASGGDADDRHATQLARLVDASLTVTSAPTFSKVAEAAVAAIAAIFDTKARVVLTRRGRQVAVWPERLTEPEGDLLVRTLPLTVEGLSGTFELVRPARPLDASERLALAQLERVTLSSVERLLLLAEAQESARERQEIVAIVSHDLRTPLQTFAMGLDAIELSVGEPAKKKIASTTARMKRSIGTMTRLLADLLDVSRIHDSVLPVRLAPQPLKPLIDELRDLYLPMAEKSGISLTAEVDPELIVVCDGARITQALSNLLSNAIRHTERGSIALTVKTTPEKRVRFEVKDTGQGIPSDVQARLFERLYQGDSSGRSGGLGLGLYIVKGIVDAHGGAVGLESEVGRGTTFWIEIPVGSPSTSAG